MFKKTIKIVQCCTFAFIFVLATQSTNAQIKIGASGGIALPMGDFADGFGMGFGGGVNGNYMLNDNMAVGLNAGYFMFGPKETLPEGFEMKFAFTPITGSFEYYFGTDGLKPYAGIDAGIYLATSTVTISIFGQSVTATGSSSNVGFAPVAGVFYELADNLDLVVNGKYNYIMTEESATSYLGVNVGVNYIMK